MRENPVETYRISSTTVDSNVLLLDKFMSKYIFGLLQFKYEPKFKFVFYEIKIYKLYRRIQKVTTLFFGFVRYLIKRTYFSWISHASQYADTVTVTVAGAALGFIGKA